MEYRLNIFTQISGFYSLVFNGDFELKPNHSSLYMFLLNQNNRCNWSEWFKCPYDLAMLGCGINSKGTYYKTLHELESFGLIKYIKGINDYKAPKINIIDISRVSNNVPLSEQVTVPLSEQLTAQQYAQQPAHIYKLITDNIKPITEKYDEFEKFVLSLSSEKPIKFNFKKSIMDLGVDENIVSDWLKVRKTKNASNTETAFNSIKDEIAISTLSPNESIKRAVEKSWSGFKAGWIGKDNIGNGTSESDRMCYFINTHSNEGKEIKGKYSRFQMELRNYSADCVTFLRFE